LAKKRKVFSESGLTKVQMEHYLVSKSFSEAFSADDFRNMYLKRYPSRNPTSILPSDFAFNNEQKARDDFPSFLEKLDTATYRFVDLEEGHEKKKRNPTWSRDELILALDFYMQHRESPPGKDSSEIASLSKEISATGKALGLTGDDDFRNPNGVYMKLMNFRRFDPKFSSEGKVGLERGGKGDEEVWNEFSNDLARLSHAARLIRDGIHDRSKETTYFEEPEIAEAPEGRLITRMHRVRERDEDCEACGFDFANVYGDRGEGYIECHHTIPLSTLEEGATTKQKDLVLLCANCHRMIHTKSPWLTVDELKALLTANKS
jgi:5-methylcytosine-specific restriction protein A